MKKIGNKKIIKLRTIQAFACSCTCGSNCYNQCAPFCTNSGAAGSAAGNSLEASSSTKIRDALN